MKTNLTNIKDVVLTEEYTQNPLMLGSIQLTLLGNKSALIENYKGLIEYHDKLIIVQSKQEQVCISGTRLRIRYYTKGEMKITGSIEKIEVKDNAQ